MAVDLSAVKVILAKMESDDLAILENSLLPALLIAGNSLLPAQDVSMATMIENMINPALQAGLSALISKIKPS